MYIWKVIEGMFKKINFQVSEDFMRENVLFSKFVLFLFFGGKKCVTYCVYMFWNNNSIKNFRVCF